MYFDYCYIIIIIIMVVILISYAYSNGGGGRGMVVVVVMLSAIKVGTPKKNIKYVFMVQTSSSIEWVESDSCPLSGNYSRIELGSPEKKNELIC